jgi:NADPH:quinone reductase-like Zn-dependent oxidoreductase
MKAVVYTQYGAPEVLHLKEVAKPVPKDNEILIKVHATTVTAGDVIMRALKVPGPAWMRFFARLYLGFWKPKRAILGMEFAGEVEAVGKAVTRFKKGDHVFGMTIKAEFGGYAEYKCMPEDGMVALKPANATFEEAAALAVGGNTALNMVRMANVRRGQKVMIYGASGSVGTYAVQIARSFGAEVTGVCSTPNIEMVKSLGAEHVIDYTREDFTQSGETYDVILNAVGKIPAAQGKKAVKAGGVYMDVVGTTYKLRQEDLYTLKQLVEAGHVQPVIDRCYPLESIVEAHRYVDSWRKRGNVVIAM